MDKEKLIKREAAAARRKGNVFNTSGKKKSKPLEVTPGLKFKSIEKEIIVAAEEVKKLGNSSFMLKMRNTILTGNSEGEGTHVDASIIGKEVDSKAVSALISKISSDPASSTERVKLVRMVMRDKREFPLSLFRNLMIQAALTIYLGDITPATLQIAGQTYRLYLENIINSHKKGLLVVHSKQLKNVNLDVISVKDLIKENEDEDAVIDENEEIVIQEIKITLKLIEFTNSLDEETRDNITMSMNLHELDEVSSKHGVKKIFTSGGGAQSAMNKQKLVVRKTLAALEVIKRIPVLHPIGLKIVAKLQQIEGKLPLPYLMEARLHMQALRILTLRVVMRDYSARPALTPTFNKAIVAYHKALKRTSMTSPKRGEITVLAEFAQISMYAYEQRKMLRLANHGVLKILEMGKKAIDVIAPDNRNYLKQQKHIHSAIKNLKKFG
ncbi:MAG: hypothetical protein H8E38_08325 [SAR324 cluster bacterium]|nr:hypothetical protein [SAR324 cluster bacterium]